MGRTYRLIRYISLWLIITGHVYWASDEVFCVSTSYRHHILNNYYYRLLIWWWWFLHNTNTITMSLVVFYIKQLYVVGASNSRNNPELEKMMSVLCCKTIEIQVSPSKSFRSAHSISLDPVVHPSLHPITCYLCARVSLFSSPPRSAIARIQFRLPDGSSFTNQFPSESRLQEARQFVAQVRFYGNDSTFLSVCLQSLTQHPQANVCVAMHRLNTPTLARVVHWRCEQSVGGLC